MNFVPSVLVTQFCDNMNIQSIRKRWLGHGVGVDSLEGGPTKKQRRTVPAHGQRQLTQREQLKKLLGQEDDSLKTKPQSNHQTAKDHTVSFCYAKILCIHYILFSMY